MYDGLQLENVHAVNAGICVAIGSLDKIYSVHSMSTRTRERERERNFEKREREKERATINSLLSFCFRYSTLVRCAQGRYYPILAMSFENVYIYRLARNNNCKGDDRHIYSEVKKVERLRLLLPPHVLECRSRSFEALLSSRENFE